MPAIPAGCFITGLSLFVTFHALFITKKFFGGLCFVTPSTLGAITYQHTLLYTPAVGGHGFNVASRFMQADIHYPHTTPLFLFTHILNACHILRVLCVW